MNMYIPSVLNATPFSAEEVRKTVSNQYDIVLLSSILARKMKKQSARNDESLKTPLTDALVELCEYK